ncbi:hypothetical protein LSH36_451g00059 [Paralvinella palmiformis]|uniref:Apple domain-containing protein n=1 Tax=Paralvinella palmiformis TaxID=53620 RepID=A0AAD9MXV4_9ANNE|nr:hypothetical protein LSH36_451g00059 [Paralvinella palmiformis]
MSLHHTFIALVAYLSSLAVYTYAQGSCTSPAWTSVSGKKLGASVQTSLQFDKDTDTYCKPQCLSQQECITFDSYLVAHSCTLVNILCQSLDQLLL